MLSTTKNDVPNGLQLSAVKWEELVDAVTLNDFADITMIAGDTGKVAVSAGMVMKDKEVTVTAASGGANIAAVQYANGKLSVTAIAEDTATVTVTASAQGLADVNKTFTVTVNSATGAAKAYVPNIDGNIIINAVDAVQNKPYAAIKEGSANNAALSIG